MKTVLSDGAKTHAGGTSGKTDPKRGNSSSPNRGRPSVSGTQEWSTHTVNCCDGCSHDCVYCFARYNRIHRMHQLAPGTWPDEKVRLAEVEKGRGFRPGTVMFPSTHDITPKNIGACEKVLTNLLGAGNQVLIVSKPHLECTKRLCRALAEFRKQILLRFTIGVMDESLRDFWEPGAPTFGERLACLEHAVEAGYGTSVSMEPLLEPWHVQELVAKVRPYVTHSIWLGTLNMVGARTKWKYPEGHPQIDRLRDWQSDERIREIYELFRNDPVIRYKDSYKQILGLEPAAEAGLDI